MLVRYLQVFAVTAYIFVAIGVVAYLDGSLFWLIPVLGPAIYFIFTLPQIGEVPGSTHFPPPRPRTLEYQAKIDARIAELKTGPAHRNKVNYIDAVSRGLPYTDDYIDYMEFPDKLVLCEYLQPFEAILRQSGLRMEHVGKQIVEVSAFFRMNILRERFQLPDCVVFTDADGQDNHAPRINVIECTMCGAELRESNWGEPWPKE